MHIQNGPSLPVDEQLYRFRKYETLYSVLDVYVAVLGDVVGIIGMELFLLCQ